MISNLGQKIEALVLVGEKTEAAKLYPLIAEFVEKEIGLYDVTFSLHDCYAGMAAAAAQPALTMSNGVREIET